MLHSAYSITQYNSKGYTNAVRQVVKSLEDGLGLFYCSYMYFNGYKFLEGPLTSESQVNQLKVYQKYASPVVHFADYTLLHTKAFFPNAHLSYYTALEAKNSIERTCAINSVTIHGKHLNHDSTHSKIPIYLKTCNTE